jgi:hypothetical protein
MPATLPLQSKPPAIPQTPPCPKCGLPMRLRGVQPTYFANLKEWSYRCDCGGECWQFVADRYKG